ncbi:MAG: aldose 1-epimerase [Chitinophagaceae bacterium]
MEFNISSIKENGLEQVILTDPSGKTQVSILPAYGAMLHRFEVTTAKGKFNIIDNYKDAAEIENTLDRSFKSSKLSPFVCRIADGKYNYDGEEFEFEKKFMDGNAIHGLLFNKPFKQTGHFADEQRAGVVFKYVYKEVDDGYPFNYSCEIRYTLLPNNLLQLQTTIINLDDLTIPMADGWHPYFTLGGKVDDWLLYFNSKAMIEFDERLIPTKKIVPYNDFLEAKPIAGTQFDNCFLLNEDDDTNAACFLRNEANGLQLNIFPDGTYPFLQVFTPDHRNSIAIENLSAIPDAFNNRIGLLMLKPRHTHSFTVHYQISCQ